ncbi:MAG: dodecin family protein [Alphaproteobacteria bacterium]
MSDTFIKTEVVGTSTESVSDAIQSALATAGQTIRNMDWFEVVDVRGSISDGKVSAYQVTLKIGFRYQKS